MKIQSTSALSVQNASSRNSAARSQSPAPAADPVESFEYYMPTPKEAAKQGLIDGLLIGACIDVATMGGPGVIGYLDNGLLGAVIGMAALPVGIGIANSIGCALNPKETYREIPK